MMLLTGLSAIRHLALNCDVGNAEALCQALAHRGENDGFGIHLGVVHEMRRQARLAARDSPDVKIMRTDNARDASDSLFDLFDIDIFRYTFEQDVDARLQQ